MSARPLGIPSKGVDQVHHFRPGVSHTKAEGVACPLRNLGPSKTPSYLQACVRLSLPADFTAVGSGNRSQSRNNDLGSPDKRICCLQNKAPTLRRPCRLNDAHQHGRYLASEVNIIKTHGSKK